MRWMLAVVGVAVLQALPAQDLGALVRQAEALGARTGVQVCDVGGGNLWSHRPNESFVPASNLKLVTAAAVLRGLGAEHAFTTRFVLQDGVLVVHAGGDPNLVTGSPYGPEVVFGAVAAALRERGVPAIRGVALDAGTWLGPDRPAGWPQDQLDRPYCAPTGGLILDLGTFSVRVENGGGQPRPLLVAPPAALPVTGGLSLVPSARDAVWGALDLGDSVKVRGRFHATARSATGTWAVKDPAAWFRAALLATLGQHGIAIDPAAPAGNGEVHVHASPLLPSLRRCLEDSSNFDAEQLLRVLGAAAGDGSLQGALRAREAQLRSLLGGLPDAVVLADGSGLDKQSRVTPLYLAEVLRAAVTGRGGAEFLAALPVGGQSGTLSDRFRGLPVGERVHAKTGWIRGASALSGVLRRADGGHRAFAILMNYDPRKDGLNRDLKALQDKMVHAIDGLRAGS